MNISMFCLSGNKSITNQEWLDKIDSLEKMLSCDKVKNAINSSTNGALKKNFSEASTTLTAFMTPVKKWLQTSIAEDAETAYSFDALFEKERPLLQNRMDNLSRSLETPENISKRIKDMVSLNNVLKKVLPPLDFKTVLHKELDEIKGKQNKSREDSVYQRAHNAHLLGLAFSGGGIRSATFNLGVLQALSELNLLKKFHYLSTVSGGGYIGSWLVSWIKHKGSVEKVSEELKPHRDKNKQEQREINFLREFSNYLTPQKGFLSIDTFTVAAMYIRNTCLNLLVLVLTLLGVLLLPRYLGPLLGRWDTLPNTGTILENWPLLMAAFLTLIAMYGVIANLRGRTGHLKSDKSKIKFTYLCVTLPLLLAAWFVTSWLWNQPTLFWNGKNLLDKGWIWIVGTGAIYLMLWLLGWILGGLGRGDNKKDKIPEKSLSGWNRKIRLLLDFEERMQKRTGLRALAVLPSSFAAGMLAGLLFFKLSGWFQCLDRPLTLTIGLIVTLAVFFAAAVLHEGISGNGFSEEAREWWARLGGTLLCSIILLTGVIAVSLYGPKWTSYIAGRLDGWGKWIISSGWALTTISGILMGRKPGKKKSRVRSILVGLAPGIFVLGLLLLLSCLMEWGLGLGDQIFWTDNHDTNSDIHWLWKWSWLYPGCVFLIAFLLSWRIGINEFSMHAMYRNRLSRCYLGASNPNRREHPFTGFDPRDNMPVSELRSEDGPGGKTIRPFPLFNTTLNLVGERRLAWQSRKAAAFVFNPLHSGFEYSTMHKQNDGPRTMQVCSAYRPTKQFGEDYSLATVMAISGAAASPNMGYFSSPALCFLMTMFNVRLGWWVANPLKASWRSGNPRFGLWHLLTELSGRTSINRNYVYLSDGGHFENLGVYELVRRRCRFIVAFDVEQDRDRKFKGLGNVIEKCRTDFGINININVDPVRSVDENGYCRTHAVIGEIRYDKVDENAPVGKLIYIKSSLTGDEPTDVLKYAASHPDFPHESTGDQWFDESQFESYRTLGYHVTDEVFKKAAQISDKTTTNRKGDIPNETLFIDLAHQWYAPARAIGVFSRHSPRLDRIHDMIRKNSELAFMDAQIYPEWESLMKGCIPGFKPEYKLPDDAGQVRAGFYLCNQMLELMEGVYHDLNLEHEWEHPDNRGWMNLFRHWSASSMLNVTWSICAANFGARFQRFCDVNLKLKMGRVDVERAKDKGFMNFRERDFINKFEEKNRNQKFEIYKLTLVTAPPIAKADLFTYHFGFAITSGDILIFYRVQDHLRKIGLARRGLQKLIEYKANDEYIDLVLDTDKVKEVSPFKLDPKEHRIFQDYFYSAKAELAQQ